MPSADSSASQSANLSETTRLINPSSCVRSSSSSPNSPSHQSLQRIYSYKVSEESVNGSSQTHSTPCCGPILLPRLLPPPETSSAAISYSPPLTYLTTVLSIPSYFIYYYYFSNNKDVRIIATLGLVTGVCLFFLGKTTCTDPGVIRNKQVDNR